MPERGESEALVADSARAFMARTGGLKRARAIRAQRPEIDRGTWREIAGLGWLGMLAPDEAGGLGLALRSAVGLLEIVGAQLLPEPLVPAMAAVDLVARSPGAPAHLLDTVFSGEQICVPALHRTSDGARLAWDAAWADSFLVEDGEGSPGVRLLARDTRGLVVEIEETVDGASLARLRLDAVDVAALPLLTSGEAATADLQRCRDLERIGYAALLTGLAAGALEMAVEYLKTRRQFGAPLGSFQALQHRAASVYVDLLSSRALVCEAAEAFGTARQSFAAAAAKARTSDTALKASKEAIQFHGAIGYTDEHDIGLFLRRAMALAAAAGNAHQCRVEIAAAAIG